MKWTYLTLAIVFLSSLAFISLADNDISINPGNPSPNDVLTCSISGEEQGFDFVWFKNDDGRENIDNAIGLGNPLNLENLDINPGDFIKCVVWLPDVIGHDQPLGRDTVMVLEPNEPPVVQIIQPVPFSVFKVGEEIRFESVVGDPDGDRVSFSINYGDGTTSRRLVDTHTYNAPGEYNIVAIAEDPSGAQFEDSISIRINPRVQVNENALPTVEIVSPEEGSQFEIGQNVPFEARANDPDGDELEIIWDFDDNLGDRGAENVGHIYNNVGIKRVIVTVRDGNGGVATDDVTITIIPEQEIKNQPPVIFVDSPEDVCLNELTVFDATRTTDDITDFGDLKFIWDVNADGTNDMVGFGNDVLLGGVSPAKPSFRFNTLGLKNIFLSVFDTDGASASRNIQVKVVPCEGNIPPVVDFEIESDRICAGDNIVFDATRTTDNKDEVNGLFFKWYFGDELPDAAGNILPAVLGIGDKRVGHLYRLPGVYIIKLIVFDKDRNEAEKLKNIEVLDCSDERSGPQVEFEIIPNENICVGSDIVFDATRTNDNNDNLRDLHFEWIVEGELLANGNGISRVGFRPVKEGPNDVELVVRDLDGNIARKSGNFESRICPRTSVYTELEILSVRPVSNQEVYSSGDEVNFIVTVKNTGSVDQVVRVLSSVPSMGVSSIGRSFDIRSRSTQSIMLNVHIPNHSSAGWHVVRVDLFGERGAQAHGNYVFLVV